MKLEVSEVEETIRTEVVKVKGFKGRYKVELPKALQEFVRAEIVNTGLEDNSDEPKFAWMVAVDPPKIPDFYEDGNYGHSFIDSGGEETLEEAKASVSKSIESVANFFINLAAKISNAD